MTLNRRDWLLLIALLGVSIVTHFVALDYPPEVIFDEVHFGKFITAYCCTGERFFDIHPPHAKLLIAGVAWLGGYRGGFSFENIGQPYGTIPVIALRTFAALGGTLLPLVIYLVLRQLGVSLPLASVGAGAVVFDNALTIQTRIIALDGLLLLSTFGSLSLFLAARRTGGSKRLALLLGSGALAGVAVGTKFTGLAALALLGVLVVVESLRRPTWRSLRRWVGYGLLVGGSAALVYLAGWALHFVLLPLPGPGDAFHVPTTLLPPHRLNPVNFLRETATLHRIMFKANYNLTAGHPNASSWWSWPWLAEPVFYWTKDSAHLYFVGNPVVWWGTTLLFIVAVVAGVVHFGQRRRPLVSLLWVPIVGFAITMLPLVQVPRALFLYHYLTPLLFSLLAALVWLERERQRQAWTPHRLHRLVITALVVILLGFVFISPLTYGLPLGTSDGHARAPQVLFWVPSR